MYNFSEFSTCINESLKCCISFTGVAVDPPLKTDSQQLKIFDFVNPPIADKGGYAYIFFLEFLISIFGEIRPKNHLGAITKSLV